MVQPMSRMGNGGMELFLQHFPWGQVHDLFEAFPPQLSRQRGDNCLAIRCTPVPEDVLSDARNLPIRHRHPDTYRDHRLLESHGGIERKSRGHTTRPLTPSS